MYNQTKRAIELILASLIILGTLIGCTQQSNEIDNPTENMSTEMNSQGTDEASSERPALVEPEMKEEEAPITEKGVIVNGDFEQYYDETWNIPGWTVDFSDWGEGEASCSGALTTEPDNDGNTTQKLSLYNGMSDPVEFSVAQEVVDCIGGEYVVTVFFEGGPDGTATGAKLFVNGASAELGNYAGWKNWKTIVSDPFTIDDGGSISIEIKGIMKSKDWLDIDDVKLITSDEYSANR